MNAAQRLATANPQRRPALGCTLNIRAHQAQRLDHPAHRPLAQGYIAGQFAVEPLPRQQTGNKPHAGARVAHVQWCRRRLQTVQANTVYSHFSILGTVDNHAQGAECRHGGQGIFTFQEAADPRCTLGESAEHDRAMGDGFVPGYPRFAADDTAGQ